MTAQLLDCPIYSQKRLSRPPVAQMKLNAQLDVAQKPTGSVVPITDTVPPPLMTAQQKKSPPCPKNCPSSKPLVAQMKLNAQLDVAQKPTGSAVPTTDTVLPPLMTALPKKLSVVKTTCGPDETECPAGCCPEANWFCCPDNRYCAATADDCPAKKFF